MYPARLPVRTSIIQLTLVSCSIHQKNHKISPGYAITLVDSPSECYQYLLNRKSLSAHLECDPQSNKCCDALTTSQEIGLLPAREQCNAKSYCEYAPEYAPRCSLTIDECQEYFETTYRERGFAVCAEGCKFYESTDSRALSVVSKACTGCTSCGPVPPTQ